MDGDDRRQASRAVRNSAKAHDTVEIAVRRDRSCDTAWTSDARIEADESVQPLALKETAGIADKRKQAEEDAEVFARTAANNAVARATRSIVERGWQPIAIGHRVDESRPGANSPVARMRKPEALLGFARDRRRGLLDAFGLELPTGRLRRGRRPRVRPEPFGWRLRRHRRDREVRSNKAEGVIR